jgi:hypothetical protein
MFAPASAVSGTSAAANICVGGVARSDILRAARFLRKRPRQPAIRRLISNT